MGSIWVTCVPLETPVQINWVDKLLIIVLTFDTDSYLAN